MPAAHRRMRSVRGGRLINPYVVDVEVVQLPGRAVAWERRRGGVDVGPLQQGPDLVDVLVAHLLLDAVGAQPGHAAADVEAGLVQRIAERLPPGPAPHAA